MNGFSHKDLEKIVALCKAQNVNYFKLDGLEMQVDNNPAPINFEKGDIKSKDELSKEEEEILFNPYKGL